MARSSKSLQIKKRKKYTSFTKGFFGRKNNCFKLSKQYYLRSLNKRYINTKTKKRIFSKKKNILINFIFRIYYGFSYNKLLFILKNNYCKINKLKIIYILLKTIF
ncbi:50S ribosomal protein L20 [Candidatus Carsonella ruddii]|uniref:Large ribosomal subunit protein bL20 n=1 Tax=Candidatus Carsonella ruddii (Diaphorina cf. continua) TaxID=2661587 RepID=A0A7R7AAV9_CARRU|nr:50S ribosomal protein L20 [Candidatus Carsonella ruddii (Diaphorina cf. continua)]BCG49325.1 50S ribosomal protein L20 [Candidatus Carsonella ruddii (Diaphorina cf. continua)]